MNEKKKYNQYNNNEKFTMKSIAILFDIVSFFDFFLHVSWRAWKIGKSSFENESCAQVQREEKTMGGQDGKE